MLESSMQQHHHRSMSFPHGGSVIHNNAMPGPTVQVSKTKTSGGGGGGGGGGRLNAVVNKLHLAKQCGPATFPDPPAVPAPPPRQNNHGPHHRSQLIQNLLSTAIVPPPPNSEKKNLRAPPALFPLTSEVTIQRYPVVHQHPPAVPSDLDVFQRLKRLGTDIEMEQLVQVRRNGTPTTSSPVLPQRANNGRPPTIGGGEGRGGGGIHAQQVLTDAAAAAAANHHDVFNNRRIPEPSVVLEVKVQSEKQQQQQKVRNNDAVVQQLCVLPRFDPRGTAPPAKDYVFTIEPSQVLVADKGQKLYKCNVCSGVYQRRGALKKHYLKAHINYRYLTSRDLQIAGFKGERLDRMLVRWKHATDQIGYYHCHKCYISYGTAVELRCHVMSHPPPPSVQQQQQQQPAAVVQQTAAKRSAAAVAAKPRELLCLYCDRAVGNEEDRRAHQAKAHPPKRKSHTCAYCQLNFFDLYTMHQHLCAAHQDVYHGCAECKERFASCELAESHKNVCLNNLCIKLEADRGDAKRELLKEEPPKLEIIELKTTTTDASSSSPAAEVVQRGGVVVDVVKKDYDVVVEEPIKEEPKKKDEESKKHEEPKKVVEEPKKESKSYYPFYCKDCKKGFMQQPNLARHMSLGHGKKLEYKKSNKLLQQSNKLQNAAAAGATAAVKVALPKKPVVVKTPEKELKDEVQDLSAKGTQYVFLNDKNEPVTKQGTLFDISYMNLETQNRIKRMLPPLNPDSSAIEDDMTSLEVEAAASYGFPSSHDAKRGKLEGFSGEWLYPRNYICSACPMVCSNIWDIFCHKWSVHPNVLCHHYDIPLDQLPCEKWRHERNLSRKGLLAECDELKIDSAQCTKCGLVESDVSQLHRHILDCGGDTEWLKTMVHQTTKSPNSKKSRRNWRPFNSRRRKNGRARHGLKRSPPTPPLPVVKTKPGDAESVSRMIADLPPKRVTRRLVLETPNGNNQATINSVPIDMSNRNPTVSSSTSTFSKRIKKTSSAIVPEREKLIAETPDFLRKLNIIRVPPKPVEPNVLPCSKTETEEIIAAMKKTLMASPAPTPIILPKKRKRPIYDFKQLAEKIAKHDHNKILDPKVEEVNDNTEETVPVPVSNKHKQLKSQIEVGLIQQNRLRRKRVIPPPTVHEKAPVPSKKAKIEVQDKGPKSIAVEPTATPIKKTKNKILSKKKIKVLEKTIVENFASKIQTRNRKKTFIEESLSMNLSSGKKEKSINNNESSISGFIDFESSQEVSLSEVPSKQSTVKLNLFKPKPKNRRKPGVFFGSRKKKPKLKSKKKNQQSKAKKDDNTQSKTMKSDLSDPIPAVSEQIEETVVQNKCDKNVEAKVKTDVETQHEPQEESGKRVKKNEPEVALTVNKENKVAAPISANTATPKEPEEVAEPRWHAQSDAFYDMPPTVSLGSILSSVNQILEDPNSNGDSSEGNDYSWTDLQRAMGATDEEMAILQNFGSNTSREGQDVANENHLDLLDLDCRQNTDCNQGKTDTQVNGAELNFHCKVCGQCYKGVAAFRIHSLDVHGIEDPELVDVIKSDYLLVCWVCKLIMEGGADELDEHLAKDHEFDDAPNSENGKELKNKMVSKLGVILDQALNNLISSTQKPSADKTWSGGAINLLGKLCALRNNEKGVVVSSSIANSALAKDLRKVIGRNGNNTSGAKSQSKKLQSAHAIRQNARLAALSEAAQRLTPMIDSDDSSSIYKCPICNIGFETTSTRNKHISRAHNSPKKSNRVETPAPSDQQSSQSTVAEQVPAKPLTKVRPMFSLGAMNRRGLKKFNSTCSEEVRARAKQALRDLEIKSRLKHYTYSSGDQSPPN